METTAYFGQLDPSKKIYGTAAEGVINAPVEKVWALFRKFGDWTTWWKEFYADMKLEPADAPTDKVGAIRAFSTISGNMYKEKLVELDEKEYRLVYTLVWAEPSVLNGAVTTVDFDAVSEGETRVTWSAQFQPKVALLASRIQQAQKSAYDLGIQALQNYFNPSIGTVSLTFTSGVISEGDGDYLLVSVREGSTQTVGLSHRGSPKNISEKVIFPVMSLDGEIQVIAMDARLLQDRQIGSARTELRELGSKKNITFELKNGNGNIVGKMNASVELSIALTEDRPSLEESVGKVALAVGRDLFNSVVEMSVAAGDDETDDNPNTPYEYASYAEEYGPLPKLCKILPAREAIRPKRTGEFFQRTSEYVYSQVPLLQATQKPELLEKLVSGDAYQAIFKRWVPRPDKVINNYMKDEEFTAQLLRGVNPVKIQVVKDKKEIPTGFHDLKDDRGRHVDDMIGDKSLFYCDYWELMVGDYDEEKGYYSHQAMNPILDQPVGGVKYWYAPILVCYKRADGKLGILGIQLTRHKSKPNEIYRADTHPRNLYQLCRFHLSCSDNQHHQFATHLGLGHLNMEPFAIAANNAFPPNPPEERHPVGILLSSHFKDTIGINWLARQTLVSEVAPLTDSTFSTGTGNGLRIFSNTYRKWHLIDDNFVNDLAKRGFDESKNDGLEGYWWREDGFKVWNIFSAHFTSIVNSLYASDGAVAKDAGLQKWCNEMRDEKRAAIKSFPAAIESRKELAEVITTIVFDCSAFHAAVNFSQLRYVTYMPNRPDSMLNPMPETPKDGKDIDTEYIAKALPSFFNSEFQAFFAYLLTTPPDNPFRIYDSMADRFPEKCEAFRKEIDRVHDEIVQRNKKLESMGEIPYEYLDPYNLPQSINI